jgi:cell fate (sporulation/competence/biofilm development) regulator YlbF (YheA/YmcA/DUF963 family)
MELKEALEKFRAVQDESNKIWQEFRATQEKCGDKDMRGSVLPSYGKRFVIFEIGGAHERNEF